MSCNKNILICGYKSFAANGLAELLRESGYTVDCFTRGVMNSVDNVITGDVFNMDDNEFLSNRYEFVINFIIIKDKGIEDNLKYLESLHKFCNKNSKKLLHISSISVYENDIKRVDEFTNFEEDSSKKGSYAAVKIECDKFLSKQEKKYALSFIRPGFIVMPEIESSTTGICVKMHSNLAILLGNKKTSLPLIDRHKMHQAIVKIIASEKMMNCYLLLENRNETKISFLKKTFDGIIIPLPYKMIYPVAFLLNKIKILNKTRFWQIKGLFKSTYFDSSLTENNIEMSLSDKSICIIGSGVYGSYAIKTITDKYPDAKITLIELCDSKIKDEKEAGFSTHLL